MKVLIVEDEHLSAERLEGMLQKYPRPIEVVGSFDSVKGASAWLNANPHPELMLFDIQLADGISFDIFEKTGTRSPVIFTTAYQEYALKAFKVNSIDYLLKPIDPEELYAALDRFFETKSNGPSLGPDPEALRLVMQMMNRQYKTRFLVKRGEHLASIATDDILYFYSEDKFTWIRTSDNKKYALDNTLEQLDLLLDPVRYFRINRQFIVAINALSDVVVYSNSRLKLKIPFWDNQDADPVLVSREKVQAFKEWLGGSDGACSVNISARK